MIVVRRDTRVVADVRERPWKGMRGGWQQHKGPTRDARVERHRGALQCAEML